MGGRASSQHRRNGKLRDVEQEPSAEKRGPDDLVLLEGELRLGVLSGILVQGLDDTTFRVYREGDRHKVKTAHWWSVAGSIDEVKELAKKLEDVDGSQAARRFANRITNAIPTFEATEEKRRRREYRQIRRAAFARRGRRPF